MKLKLLRPLVSDYISQEFGENKNPFYQQMGMLGHNGIDFPCQTGSPVYASHDGLVTFTGMDGSGGYGVVIRTTNKYEYKGTEVFFKSIYWHLKADGIKVLAGQQVKAGDLIALANNTGMSTGSHLHWGLKPIQQGEAEWAWFNLEQNAGYLGAIDPLPYMVDSFYVDMSYGQTNRYIRELQKFLGVMVTGFYGELTRRAVLDFQIKNVNLSWYERYVLKGKKVGPKTREALNRQSL